MSRTPDEPRGGHLNSDIGGATPRTSKTWDRESDGVGPSKRQKKKKSTSEQCLESLSDLLDYSSLE